MLKHRSAPATGIAVVAAVIALVAAVGASATSTVAKPDVQPKFVALPTANHTQADTTHTAFHFWQFGYTDPVDHNAYSVRFIGADPNNSNYRDQNGGVRTVIIPLRMHFYAGGQDTSSLNDLGYAGFTAPPLNHTFDGGRRVADVLKSPIFSEYKYPADMGGDTAQYGDAFMRAQWNKIGTNYHVKLYNVRTYPTVDVDVPPAYGLAYQRPVGAWRTAHGMPTDTIAGVADFGWFANFIVDWMNANGINYDVMPIFLTDNVMLYDGGYTGCCVIGFHGTPASAVSTSKASLPAAQRTLMYAAWTTPGTYSGFLSDYTGNRSAPSPTRGLSDIHALSHEVAEAFDDPFVDNYVMPWLTPTAPQYGCTPVLETGDPVVGPWFGLDGNNTGSKDGYNYYGQYHPEEEVFAQWFTHGALEQAGYPSWDGRLTFMGPRLTGLGGPWVGFNNYSQGCN